MILTDTNVLVYAVNCAAPQHDICREFVEAVRAKKINGVLFPQIVLEFYAVTTNPRRFPSPLSPGTAWEQVGLLCNIFPVIDASSQAISRLRATAPAICGGDVFDGYLLAQMIQAGISVICTYNVKYFERFEGILAHTPEEILKQF